MTAFLLVWGTVPAAANDRLNDSPAVTPTLEMTAASIGTFVPMATVTPSTFTEQMPQTVLTRPRFPKTDGLSGSALRRSLIVSFGALQALDAHSTMKALKSGGSETNPMMSGIASNGATLFAVKAGTAAAVAYFAERVSKNHPKRAVVLMAVLNSAYVAVVAHNYRVARGGR